MDKRLIHLVDDEDAIRRSTGFLLKTCGFEVKAYESGVAFLKEVKTAAPGCILLDVRMPEMDGLAVQQELNARGVMMPVIVLTGHGDIAIAVRAMKAGAVEVLTKPFRAEDVLGAIRLAIERSRAVLREEAVLRGLRESHALLSEREREVMALVVSGLLNKQVAAELGISEITVKAHRGKVMRKMKAASLADLVTMAARLGVAPGPRRS